MKIVVNFKKKLELCSREMIQQFNIIFKRIFNVLKFKMHNRNFYDPESAEAIKQHNLSIWPGNNCAITNYIPYFLKQYPGKLIFEIFRWETYWKLSKLYVMNLTISWKKGGKLFKARGGHYSREDTNQGNNLFDYEICRVDNF